MRDTAPCPVCGTVVTRGGNWLFCFACMRAARLIERFLRDPGERALMVQAQLAQVLPAVIELARQCGVATSTAPAKKGR